MPSELKNIVDKHDDLDSQRRDILHQIQQFNVDITKHLLEHFPQALSINWSTLRRIIKREVN